MLFMQLGIFYKTDHRLRSHALLSTLRLETRMRRNVCQRARLTIQFVLVALLDTKKPHFLYFLVHFQLGPLAASLPQEMILSLLDAVNQRQIQNMKELIGQSM